MALESIRYSPGTNSLSIIDQLRLPHTTSYLSLRTAADAWHSIRAMNVRGAPAIAIVAVLALAVELRDLRDVGALPAGAADVAALIRDRLAYLVTSRPTAVNLADAAGKLGALAAKEVDALGKEGGEKVMAAYVAAAERMVEEDVADNRRIGEYGARWVKEHAATAATGAGDGEITVLTHCNTGSLATAGYGTALGVIRSLHAAGALARVFCTETRPYNQGARLTAYELVHDRIPATLITDSMAAALLAGAHHSVLPPKDDSPSQDQTMTPTRIGAIIVGADRIAANGDTANKIGTYSLAVLARAHGARFVVAAPRASIDLRAPAGTHIRIEQRPAPELTRVTGPVVGATGEKEKTEPKTDYQPPASSSSATVVTAADGIDVWNPAFDVTPATLIDAIVTEVGIAEPQGPEHGFRLAELLAEAS